MLNKKDTAASRETQPEASKVQKHFVLGTWPARGASLQNALGQCSALGRPFMLKFGVVVQVTRAQVLGPRQPGSE